MKRYLIKHNRNTIDFILLERKQQFIYISRGKVGKSGIGKSTQKASSRKEATKRIEQEIERYIGEGYQLTQSIGNMVKQDIVFDKAKWHVNDEFPQELDSHQSYVHTGLYVAWLLEKDLLDPDFKSEHAVEVSEFLSRKTHPSDFYKYHFDGIFMSEGWMPDAVNFSKSYFDIQKGDYLVDYENILNSDRKLPSLFHVIDSWENYDKIKPIIDRRFDRWKSKKNNLKWWQKIFRK